MTRKRAEAAKAQHEVSNPRAGEVLTPDQRYLLWKESNPDAGVGLVVAQPVQVPKHREPPDKTRQAKAAASHTNRGAVERGDKLANERPDLAEKVRSATIAPPPSTRSARMPELELFACPRHVGDLRITATTCAGMWTRARRDREEDRIRLAPCMGCQVGAAHAGEAVSAKAAPDKATPASVGPTCTRCGRGGRRLVIGRTLCVSCHNRQREYRAGRNAKGGPTRDYRPLFCALTGVVDESGAVQPTLVEWVASPLEAMLRVQRATGTSRFGRTTSGWRDATPYRQEKPQPSGFGFGAGSRPVAPPTA